MFTFCHVVVFIQMLQGAYYGVVLFVLNLGITFKNHSTTMVAFRQELQSLFHSQRVGGSFTQFSRAVSSEEAALKFFKLTKLINLKRGRCTCGNVGLLKRTVLTSKFGFYWVCPAMTHRTVKCFSPLEGTIFADSSLPFIKIFDLMLSWMFKQPFDLMMANAKVSEHTVTRWLRKFREVCETSTARNQIGGPGHWVEIDETHLFRRKYHVGHRIVGESVWILGGVDRETKGRFVVRVKNRKKETLWPIIKDHVLPGSILVTDDFASYHGIDQELGFAAHEVVIHRENFKNPLFPDVYTNGVECLWSKLKKVVKRTGTNDQIDCAIGEFLYRHKLHQMFGRMNFGAKFEYFLMDMKNHTFT